MMLLQRFCAPNPNPSATAPPRKLNVLNGMPMIWIAASTNSRKNAMNSALGTRFCISGSSRTEAGSRRTNPYASHRLSHRPASRRPMAHTTPPAVMFRPPTVPSEKAVNFLNGMPMISSAARPASTSAAMYNPLSTRLCTAGSSRAGSGSLRTIQ